MSDVDQTRKNYIRALIILVGVILIGRALHLQVLDGSYAELAEATAIEKLTLYPARGLIYDRNRNLLIHNNPVFDLWVTYNQVSKDMDVGAFCELLSIDTTEYKKRLNKDWSDIRYSRSKPFVFLSTISAQTYGAFQERLFEFPGFFVQPRNVRGYPQAHGAHVLGFIREVNASEVENSEGSYQPGDYIGASGLEKAYEDQLKGVKGAQFVLKDNLGRIVGSYKDGSLDTSAVAGTNLITTLDIDLQTYAEKLMVNKIGAVVAIEPATGEILLMASMPTYDPNRLTISRERGQAVQELSQDSLKPFFNRTVMAQYAPGSIFKPVLALIGLEEDAIQPSTSISCPGYYAYNNFTWGCRGHPPTPNVSRAIQYSCNTYFFQTFRRIVDQKSFYEPQVGLDTLVEHLYQFGLGRPLGVDVPWEEEGLVPTSEYYDRKYPREKGGWKSPTILSVGIGQGEIQLTTLQMANMAAIIANRGFYITPHLGKFLVKGDSLLPLASSDPWKVDIRPELFEPVIQGMMSVVEAGTGRAAGIPGISMAGKTGTVENPHGIDHSTFIAFAPAENPEIAIAVYVENAGGGGRYAAPIAGLLIEQFLNKSVHPSKKYLEDWMFQTNLISKP
ncbi:MAG: penicillin-binding protein 2 [Saprospiraceae bacterium]|nr:penicillin-binding protein 2 [Saprospiraceae bacterium]MCB0623602.1 penicillin-binding protein 2 [Saprospiraceae bacterium]MCB0682101.1 penicillin-binding protein 2 [Saprospiraceae bacterium]